MHFVSRLQTPFGPVRVAYTGGGHVAVLADHETGPFLVQHRSPLALNLHLYRDGNGNFVPKDPAELILSKLEYERFNDRDASPTARKRVLETLPPLVTEFLNAHPAECAAEDVDEIERQIERTDREIEKLEEQIEPLVEKRLALSKALQEALTKV